MINKVELLPTNKKSDKKTESLLNIIIDPIKGMSLDKIPIYIMTLFISRGAIMEGLTPFGIALVTAYALKHGRALLVAVISCIGVISYHGYSGASYIFTILAVLICVRMIKNRTKVTTLRLALLASFITVITKISIILINDLFLYDIVMSVFEGIIVFSLTYIFTYSIGILEGLYDRPFTSEELICGAIMLSLAVSGIGNLALFGLSVKNVIGISLIIAFGFLRGPSMGAAVGITIGVVTAMSTPNMPLIISAYGFAGLLSGLFRELGKVGSGIGFILGIGIMSFYINGFTEVIIQFNEILAGIILLIITLSILEKTNSEVFAVVGSSTPIRKSYRDRVKDVTYKRLQEVSKVFEELSTTFQRAADLGKISEQTEISKFINTIVDDTCKECAMYRFCWVNDFYTTYNSLFDVLNILELEGDITEERFEEIFRNRCIKSKDVIQKSKYLFNIYKLNYEWKNRLFESRQLVSQQLQGISSIINDIAKDIDNDVLFKEDVEKSIFSELKKNKINVKEVIVTESRNGKFEITIEVKSPQSADSCIKQIIPIVSKITGVELVHDKYNFSIPDTKKGYRFRLIKANKFGAITKVSRSEKSFNYISGDSYTFGESDNNYYVALSDGMGVGQKANQESDITISLLEKFIEAGFEKEVSLKTINSILVLKSSEEMLSTIDMAIVDLFNGKAQFVKTGAAPTFIKRKDRVDVLNAQTLPLGILKDVDFQVYEEKLEDGDFIIMMSDGVLDANMEVENKEEWMINIINEINTVNPQRLADQIIDKAQQASGGLARDDMTVLVTKVWKRRKNKGI